ncbi:hypothetical protein A7N05_19135 [Acinetobacter baumannii]|nr:hypothetical protein A7N05_19135 [Acinetobacter baumannii]
MESALPTGFASPDGSQTITPWPKTPTMMDPPTLASFKLTATGGAMTTSSTRITDATWTAVRF